MSAPTMNLTQIIEIAESECVRQQVGPDRVVMLLKAFARAYQISRLPDTDAGHVIMMVAQIVEPANLHGFRKIPVTFANGARGVSPELIPTALASLIVNHPKKTSEEIEAFIKSFLEIHPFVDGNGRTAWILRTWLTNTWDAPETLPTYDFVNIG